LKIKLITFSLLVFLSVCLSFSCITHCLLIPFPFSVDDKGQSLSYHTNTNIANKNKTKQKKNLLLRKTIQNNKGGGLRFEDLETFSMNVGFHAKIEVGV
jgi:hypothetical protein